MKSSVIKKIKIKIFQLTHAYLKMENCTWKYAWLKRSQGTTDMKTWE